MSVFAGGCDLPAFSRRVCRRRRRGARRPRRAGAYVVRRRRRRRPAQPATGCSNRSVSTPASCSTPVANTTTGRRRHLDHYAGFARALHDGEDESGIVPLDELLGELGNLRVALDWAADEPEEADVGLWLAADLYDVWTAGAHHDEGLRAPTRAAADRPRVAGRAIACGPQRGDRRRPHGPRRCRPSPSPSRRSTRRARGASSAQERRARQVLAQFLRDRGDVAKARRTLAPALPTGSEQTTDVDAFCLVTKVELDLVVGALDEAEATARRVLTGRIRIPAVARTGGPILARRDHARAR